MILRVSPSIYIVTLFFLPYSLQNNILEFLYETEILSYSVFLLYTYSVLSLCPSASLTCFFLVFLAHSPFHFKLITTLLWTVYPCLNKISKISSNYCGLKFNFRIKKIANVRSAECITKNGCHGNNCNVVTCINLILSWFLYTLVKTEYVAR